MEYHRASNALHELVNFKQQHFPEMSKAIYCCINNHRKLTSSSAMAERPCDACSSVASHFEAKF